MICFTLFLYLGCEVWGRYFYFHYLCRDLLRFQGLHVHRGIIQCNGILHHAFSKEIGHFHLLELWIAQKSKNGIIDAQDLHYSKWPISQRQAVKEMKEN